ncbi:GtrA family protein [Paractinoplanes atraurantiacus]|uniref:Putative flippase GtrA (Transmembrane translocase of bactoprenol-linked glucose) n=1 Tax=Paractinoplanes atraurantiacus TaxID=1036182 RepID=A0A285F4K9_9ACTN|nr:GtrA family protein [Actinoplanes atraurantiacus]SNY06239.1 Putative flippase GtrA (transmembrane translocase of bactoprenol-linked glucose) [Actinoplanes atraurantiacus]
MTTGSRAGVGLGETALRITRSSGFRFLIVGGTSVVVDAGLLWVLHGLVGMWLEPATAIAFLAGFLVNFLLNRQWAFASTGRLQHQLAKYLALVAVNLLITVLLVKALTALGVMYLIAKVLTTAALSTINYFISRKWIFI